MSNFVGETISATNPNTGAEEQAAVVEVHEGGMIKLQFEDGTLSTMQSDQVTAG